MFSSQNMHKTCMYVHVQWRIDDVLTFSYGVHPRFVQFGLGSEKRRMWFHERRAPIARLVPSFRTERRCYPVICFYVFLVNVWITPKLLLTSWVVHGACPETRPPCYQDSSEVTSNSSKRPNKPAPPVEMPGILRKDAENTGKCWGHSQIDAENALTSISHEWFCNIIYHDFVTFLDTCLDRN